MEDHHHHHSLESWAVHTKNNNYDYYKQIPLSINMNVHTANQDERLCNNTIGVTFRAILKTIKV